MTISNAVFVGVLGLYILFISKAGSSYRIDICGLLSDMRRRQFRRGGHHVAWPVGIRAADICLPRSCIARRMDIVPAQKLSGLRARKFWNFSKRKARYSIDNYPHKALFGFFLWYAYMLAQAFGAEILFLVHIVQHLAG
ncbi:hypothetical protein [Rhizobium sp. RCAM05973]|uniref:hypothetical protein n=1 Tax=Rhizobium sp. RCAM05973 TaxID=2994066 RepID=UPI0022EBD667|nr:hypothetical protein [Rhizobium sp. RCAM05973]